MEKPIPNNIERIDTILKKSPLPFQTSPGNSSVEPEKECPAYGSPLRFVFMDNPSYLKVTGKEPHWAVLSCAACDRLRFMEEQEEKEKAASQKRLNALIANSMLRERFLTKTFDNFIPFGQAREKQLRVLALAKDFADNFAYQCRTGPWLLFMGNVGSAGRATSAPPSSTRSSAPAIRPSSPRCPGCCGK